MTRLLDHFSPVISEVLRLSSERPPAGGYLETVALRSRLASAVQAALRSAGSDGARPERDLRLAGRGVTAWIDETMQDDPEWGTVAQDLEDAFSDIQDPREAFFHDLEQLDESQDEVREVYYLLLCLGYRGRYQERSDGPEELERLKDLHGRRLRIAPVPVTALVEERLTPQPYEVAPPPRSRPAISPTPPEPKQAPPPPRSRFVISKATLGPLQRSFPRRSRARARPKKRRPALILGLVLAALAVLTLLGKALTPWWLRQAVDTQITGRACAHVNASIGSDRVVKLEGYVSSTADRDSLLSGLEGTFGIAGVKGDVAVYPWPYCEALDVVRPYFEQNIGSGLNLGIDVTAPNGVLKAGDPLALKILTPSYPAYLYIDYYQQNGDVAHIAHADPNGTPDKAGDRFDYPTGYEGSEPYGRELITIFASPSPLFDQPLPAFENAATYLPKLRRRLKQLSDGPDGASIAASLVFIRTER